jgi:hypothetical protein
VFCYAFLIQLTLWRVALCFSSCRRYDLFSLALSLGTFLSTSPPFCVLRVCISTLESPSRKRASPLDSSKSRRGTITRDN